MFRSAVVVGMLLSDDRLVDDIPGHTAGDTNSEPEAST